MESASAHERKGGVAERTRRRLDEEERETRESATNFIYEGNSADDELATLMPALKRRFEAFDEDEGTLNFMGEVNASNEASFQHNENKENVPQRRRKSGRKSTAVPFDFDKSFKTFPPSGSLYKNITTALKENVNNADLQSQNVDDFWATERQKKISAVARRKLAGIETPAQAKVKPVENRRRARSRGGGENGRKPGKRPIKWDLYLDAAKISEWDQETLAEEDEIPSTRANCGAFLSAGRPALQSNFADSDQERKVGTQQGALGADRPEDDGRQGEEGSKANLPVEPSPKAGSLCSLPDMDLSAGESPAVEVTDFLDRGQLTQNPLQDQSSAHPDLAMEEVIIPGDGVNREAIGHVWPSRCAGEDHDSHPEKTILQDDSLLRDSNLEGDPPFTPTRQGLPGLDSCNPHIERLAATSPTPPSNPVAVYMSLRHVDGDVRQRRLAFLSSPSNDSSETGSSREGEELNSVGESSGRDSERVEPHDLASSKDNVEGEEVDLVAVESKRASSPRAPHNLTTSKDDIETDYLQGKRLVFGEGELLTDLCNRREHKMAASKDDLQGGKWEEFGSERDACHRATHQTALGDIAQAEESNRSNEISAAAPCDGAKLQEEDEVRERCNQVRERGSQVRELPCSEENLPAASCDGDVLHSTDEVRTQKDEGVERDGVASPVYLRHSSMESDDNKSIQDQTVKSNASVPRPGENALLALSYDYPEDDVDLEVPDVKETDPPRQERNGTSLAGHTEPDRLVQNRQESFGEVGVEKDAQIPPPEKTKDSEAVPPVVNGEGGPIKSDEGSTTQIKPKRLARKRAPKAKNKRSSLEGCGSLWKDGQRRSQRIRVNPVKWWRGEKLLYGRIHDSLSTVIGIKYTSRGDDKPFAVESYVPAEYDELVAFAAI